MSFRRSHLFLWFIAVYESRWLFTGVKAGDSRTMYTDYCLYEPALDNRVMQTLLVFKNAFTSRILTCAAMCQLDSRCLSFFYNKKRRYCQGHTAVFHLPERGRYYDGNKYYIFNDGDRKNQMFLKFFIRYSSDKAMTSSGNLPVILSCASCQTDSQGMVYYHKDGPDRNRTLALMLQQESDRLLEKPSADNCDHTRSTLLHQKTLSNNLLAMFANTSCSADKVNLTNFTFSQELHHHLTAVEPPVREDKAINPSVDDGVGNSYRPTTTASCVRPTGVKGKVERTQTKDRGEVSDPLLVILALVAYSYAARIFYI